MIQIFDSQNVSILNVDVDDKSYRYRALKGEHTLTLYFALYEYVEIPIGAYVIYQSQRYTLMTPTALKMVHTRNFEYTLTLQAAQARLESYMFRDLDQRLSFSLTAKPEEHLEMLIRNLNAREGNGVWSAGDCVTGDGKVVNYDYMNCAEALEAMANEFDTEWEVDGNVISLHKVEYNKQQPLPLGYGKGKGFRSGVGRSGKSQPVEIMCLQTSDRNIYYSTYGAKTLMLPPAGSTLRFDGTDFVNEGGREYIVNSDRYSIKRADRKLSTNAEACLDCTEIYPSMEHVITSVDAINPRVFAAADIPESLNYRNCRVAGEVMSIVFQSGELTGREFDIKQSEKALTGYDHETRTFTIVAADVDGTTLPNEVLRPAVGDKFKVFQCALPDAYICDNESQTGASWELFRKAVRGLYDDEDQKYTFTGELDPIWAARNWLNVSGIYLRLGGYIRFTDERWQKEPIDIRIVGIKDYVNSPHAPELELSNEEVSAHVSSKIKEIESDAEVSVRDTERKAMTYSKRRWSDAMESMAMLQDAIDGYDGNINPASVHSLMMLVGDESLQFRFEDISGASADPIFTPEDGVFKVSSADGSGIIILHHLTLGVKTITSEASGEWRFTMGEYTSAVLDDAGKAYYLYAVCSESELSGKFELSPTPYPMHEEGSDLYYFLVGTLSSEHEDGQRSFQTLYGFTEISGGRILTDVIRSADGRSFFNLENGSFNLDGKMTYNVNGDGTLVIDGASVQRMVLAQEGNIENLVAGNLKTAETGKRVVIYDNELTMFDSSNNMKLKVSGDEIGGSGSSGSYHFESMSHTEVGTETEVKTGEEELCTFVCESGNNAVVIPEITLTAHASSGRATTSDREFVYVEAKLLLDGKVVSTIAANTSSEEAMRSPSSSVTHSNTYSFRGSLSQGTHVLKVRYTMMFAELPDQTARVSVYGGDVSVSYISELVTIGSNGFSATFGNSDNKAEFIRDSSGNVSLEMVVNGKGIRVTESGVQKNTGSGWENL